MKKILIIGLVCILIGGLFVGAAYSLGERYIDTNLTSSDVSFTTDDVKNITVGDHIAEIRFVKDTGSSGNITVKAENIIESEYSCSLANGALDISYSPKSVKIGIISLPPFMFNFNNINKPSIITVYIPNGKIFDEVYFKGGVGKVEAEQINAQSFTAEGGVGAYDIKDMTTGTLNVKVGVGSVKINGVINGDTKIEGGVGEVIISGRANGNIKLSAGVGSVILNLTGNVQDYNIKANKGLGGINLNGKDISDSINNNGKYNLDIDAGVGSININISE